MNRDRIISAVLANRAIVSSFELSLSGTDIDHIDLAKIKDSTICETGKLIEENKKNPFIPDDQAKKLEELHDDFHVLSDFFIKLSKSDRMKTEAKAIFSGINDKSLAIVDILMKLKK